MAKKRKDLSGQLDRLFAGFEAEEKAEAKEEKREEPQALDELLRGAPAEPVEAERAEVLAEVPAVDALFAEEPVEQPVEAPVRLPAIDELLAAEPVTEEVEPEAPELMAEVVEEVAPEPTAPEAVELPSMAELLAVEEAAPEAAAEVAPEPTAPEAVELPSMAELLAVEEVEAVAAEEAVPEVVAEAAVEPTLAEAGREIEELVAPGALPWEKTIQEQRTRILNALLIFITAVATVVVFSLVLFSLDNPSLWLDYIPYFIAWAVLVGLTLARRLDPLWRTISLVVLAFVVGAVNLFLDGPLGAGWLYLLLAPLLLSTLVGRRAGVYAAMGSFGIYLVFAVAHYLGWLEPVAALKPENWTWATVLLNMSGTFGLILAAATMIQWMFNSSLVTSLREAEDKHAETMRSQALLKRHAEELTATNVMLQKRSLQLETAGQVSQAASSVLDPGELMQQAADLIRERFDLYYVGLFLTTEAGADAGSHGVALRAGTGEIGRRMLSQGYGVEVGDSSAVGQCTARGQAQTVRVDGRRLGFVGDLSLQTHSEVALPMRSRGRVLGALDVHHTGGEVFSQEDIAVLQTMADHIAVAIDNAQLFAELRQRLQEMEASQRLYVREQWADLAPRRLSPLYERARPDAAPLADAALSEAREVALRREVIAKPGGDGGMGEAALVAPIALRGEIIGALGLQETEGGRQWTEDEIALIEAVADQMALAIENVRLLEETRQLAGWEQTLSDMTARFTRSLDTQTLLQTAIQELGQLLQVDEVSVHIGAPDELGSTGEEEMA
jgi:GAF domain-containing protein